jgi:protease secretion system outer membrane protein
MILHRSIPLQLARKRLLPLMLAALIAPSGAYAIDMTTAFALAKRNDPKFQAAKAEMEATKSQAVRDWASYAPTYTWSQQQLPTLSTTSTTQSVNQPLFDLAKASTVLQGSSRNTLATAGFDVQSQDLANRTVNVINQIVLATEAIKANAGQIDALESQYKGAKRKFELGQGTVTDLLDVEVKFQQAKANDLTLRANLKGARDQFAAIVGERPADTDFTLPNQHETFKVDLLDEILARAEKSNPNVVVAKANERIAKLDITKVGSAAAPTVGYTYSKTQRNDFTTENNGLTISIPIDIASYINTYTAVAKSKQSSSIRLQTETQIKVEAQRLFELIQAGQESLKIKGQAVDTARKSVVANQKSYEAGVKSTTDVLIAIQTLYQTRNEYAQAATQQASQLLNLLLVGAEDADNAVMRTQAFLFRK